MIKLVMVSNNDLDIMVKHLHSNIVFKNSFKEHQTLSVHCFRESHIVIVLCGETRFLFLKVGPGPITMLDIHIKGVDLNNFLNLNGKEIDIANSLYLNDKLSKMLS